MAIRRTARGARHHRVLALPVPTYQRDQGSHHGRCRARARGGGHGSGRRRRAPVRRVEPSRIGVPSHAPAAALVAVVAAIVLAAIAIVAAAAAIAAVGASTSNICAANNIFAAALGAGAAAAVVAPVIIAPVIIAPVIAAAVIVPAAIAIAVAVLVAADHSHAPARAQADAHAYPDDAATAGERCRKGDAAGEGRWAASGVISFCFRWPGRGRARYRRGSRPWPATPGTYQGWRRGWTPARR